MSVVLNGRTYTDADFAGLGYVAFFPELIFSDMLAELATWDLAQFESAAYVLTASAVATEAHGLGARPNRVWGVLQCVSAELGFAVGDEIPIGQVATTAGVQVLNVSADSTNIEIIKGAGAPAICRKDATIGTVTAIDISKWRVIVRANK